MESREKLRIEIPENVIKIGKDCFYIDEERGRIVNINNPDEFIEHDFG